MRVDFTDPARVAAKFVELEIVYGKDGGPTFVASAPVIDMEAARWQMQFVHGLVKIVNR